MQIRKITASEKLQVDMLKSIAFLTPIDVEAERKKAAEDPDTVRFENTWACFDSEGKVVSALENHPFAMHYEGHVVGAGGIGGVVSAPESRRRGNIRAILQQVFADDLRRGNVFSILYPFSHSYYRQFGYEICHEARSFLLPVQALHRYVQTADARMADPAGSAPFAKVYARYASRYNYALSRGEVAWERVLRGDTYRAEAYRYLLSRDGEDIAYCMFRPVHNAEHSLTLLLTDYAYVDRAALHDLLGFLHRLSAQFRSLQIEVPSDMEPSALVDEAYDVQQAGLSRTMARVLDVTTALRLLRNPCRDGSYTVHVEDGFLTENTGTYTVTHDGQNASVHRDTGTAPDLSLSVQTLAQLCLGYLSLDMALLKPDVTLSGNEALLGRMFVRKPMFLSDRF